MARVLLLEFNEITPSLFEPMIDAGLLPHFQRLRAESEVFVTDAEESPPRLEPWVQWVTVHSGRRATEHGVVALNQAARTAGHNIWDVLQSARRRSLVCGSMNVSATDSAHTWIVPDPWDAEATVFPEDLRTFHEFVRAAVAEHLDAAGVHTSGATRQRYFSFLAYMVRHGLSMTSLAAILRGYLAWNGGKRARRAVLLDHLLLDVFLWAESRFHPDFAALFLNSVAHFQHNFWRDHDAPAFAPTAEASTPADPGAIEFGYRHLDGLLGRVLKRWERGGPTTVFLCGGLSQQPCLRYEAQGGKTTYVTRDPQRLIEAAGIDGPVRYIPLMNPQFILSFPGADATDSASRRLEGATIAEGPLLSMERLDSTRLLCVCNRTRPASSPETSVSFSNGTSARFEELFCQVPMLTSGMHHPEGVLWIRTPSRKGRVHQERRSLCAIAPTILSACGLRPPPWMKVRPIPIEL